MPGSGCFCTVYAGWGPGPAGMASPPVEGDVDPEDEVEGEAPDLAFLASELLLPESEEQPVVRASRVTAAQAAATAARRGGAIGMPQWLPGGGSVQAAARSTLPKAARLFARRALRGLFPAYKASS
ncbi:hypothetical protein GCM10010319_05840 [Streptomyces blastmyceticus]|uniref:Uncharacterized protein n=1 Tax=Streptomyces blastmyceticus TaxID=68180 RepID=A0ABN0WCQ5_9ACTN